MTGLHASIANIPMPPRMRALPLNDAGFPVLFFADEVNGKPDLRVMDGRKLTRCIRGKLCWLCGQPLGRNMAFVIGPMCAITRTTAEPPSHYECAAYAVRACPFLARPRMHRRTAALPEQAQMAGTGLTRNPGASAIWITRSYKVWNPRSEFGGNDGILLTIGAPERVEWYAEGRPASRAEVGESIETGLPSLYELCGKDKNPQESRRALRRKIEAATALLPWA